MQVTLFGLYVGVADTCWVCDFGLCGDLRFCWVVVFCCLFSAACVFLACVDGVLLFDYLHVVLLFVSCRFDVVLRGLLLFTILVDFGELVGLLFVSLLHI